LSIAGGYRTATMKRRRQADIEAHWELVDARYRDS